MKRAVYPGTFDPFTHGHEDIVRKASVLFDHITIAVAAQSSGKKHLFTLEERVDMVQASTKKYTNIAIIGFQGLLVSLIEKSKFTILLRGLRAVSDFEYEFQMAHMNHRLNTQHETVFLIPSEENQFISSTIVREIAALKGQTQQFVNPYVEKKLIEKYA